MPDQVSDLVKIRKFSQALPEEALDLILDVVGITDIQNCFKGQISGCIWAAVGALPFGKMFKIAKAMPALRKLVSKAGDIRDAFKARKARVSSALDRVITPPGCLRRAGFTGGEAYPFATAGQANTGDTRFEYPGWREPWAGFTEVAEICNIPKTVVYTPQGRAPIMARYAGQGVAGLPKKTQDKIAGLKGDYSAFRYKDTGYPDFSPWVAKHPDTGKPVRLTDFEYQRHPGQDQTFAFGRAKEEFDLPEEFRTSGEWTWHHSEIEGVMELIPRELNGAVPHTGGRSMWSPDAKSPTSKSNPEDATWTIQQDFSEKPSFHAVSSEFRRSKNLWDCSFPKVTGISSDKLEEGLSI